MNSQKSSAFIVGRNNKRTKERAVLQNLSNSHLSHKRIAARLSILSKLYRSFHGKSLYEHHSLELPIQIIISKTRHAIYTGLNHSHSLCIPLVRSIVPFCQSLPKNFYKNRSRCLSYTLLICISYLSCSQTTS